jgi:hypothetical protein
MPNPGPRALRATGPRGGRSKLKKPNTRNIAYQNRADTGKNRADSLEGWLLCKCQNHQAESQKSQQDIPDDQPETLACFALSQPHGVRTFDSFQKTVHLDPRGLNADAPRRQVIRR